MYQPQSYKAIEVWGHRLGSYMFYIHDQQRRAAEENAPLTAIYKHQDGSWVTIADITNLDTREEVMEDTMKLFAK